MSGSNPPKIHTRPPDLGKKIKDAVPIKTAHDATQLKLLNTALIKAFEGSHGVGIHKPGDHVPPKGTGVHDATQLKTLNTALIKDVAHNKAFKGSDHDGTTHGAAIIKHPGTGH